MLAVLQDRAALFSAVCGLAGGLLVAALADPKALNDHLSNTTSPLATVEPMPSASKSAIANPYTEAPLRLQLRADGVLELSGLIDPGSANRFIAEVSGLGVRPTAVALQSPGGSINDAIRIARHLRQMKVETRIENGAICASSCPLVFAGGVTRTVEPNAFLGVHQFYADHPMLDPAHAMADAQLTAARISRYLMEMGVDPALWLHALDTPPDQLYYLSKAELKTYSMVTEATR